MIRFATTARLALAAAFVLAQGIPASAQISGGVLRGEFWADLEPVSKAGDPWPVPPEEAGRRILAEAAWAFSGVVYGFEFSYTPYDSARGLKERFELRSLGSIAPESLSPAGAARPKSSYELRAYIEYGADEAQRKLMGSYLLDPWKGSQGIGRADILGGVEARATAYSEALREAVRSYLRDITPNKPRLVRGRVAFERLPTLSLVGGYYVVQARVRVMTLESLPYAAY